MLVNGKALIPVLLSATIIGCSLLSGRVLSAPSPCHAPAQKGARVATNSFYEALEDYGDWFSIDQYGRVWMP